MNRYAVLFVFACFVLLAMPADAAETVDISGKWVSTAPRTSSALQQTMTFEITGPNIRNNGSKIEGTLELPFGKFDLMGDIVGDKVYLVDLENYSPDFTANYWFGRVVSDHEIVFTHRFHFFEKYLGDKVPNLDYDHEGGEQPFEHYESTFSAFRAGPQD